MHYKKGGKTVVILHTASVQSNAVLARYHYRDSPQEHKLFIWNAVVHPAAALLHISIIDWLLSLDCFLD